MISSSSLPQALPSFQFPGKGVVAVQGGDHAGSGTSATLEVTFKAKSSTAEFPNGGFAPVTLWWESAMLEVMWRCEIISSM